MNAENKNDIIWVTEKIYYEVNPTTRMDVPSSAYETVERWEAEWRKAGTLLSLYDWIHINKNNQP